MTELDLDRLFSESEWDRLYHEDDLAVVVETVAKKVMAPASGWVSVEEPPEAYGWYYKCVAGESVGGMAYYGELGWDNSGGTHWCKLPEPPKGVRDE